ncbi:hypothetical protein WISP_55523 [Willisornis vidua]|uniref:Uncharacterized protein n=1 Tax=Willisornis vidua TaxID=1566151 RepID=A0ABQ9DGT8_9PASS|nr:hypothetical protein WISP_55523 [Willisornis vidua]
MDCQFFQVYVTGDSVKGFVEVHRLSLIHPTGYLIIKDQIEKYQLPQPVLIRLVLQTLLQLQYPSLDMFQHLNVFLLLRGPNLNTGFKVLVSGAYRGVFSEKRSEAFPTSDRANASQLQNGSATGQGRASQEL